MNNLFLYFLREEASLLSDVDLYNLYKTYKNKAFESLIDGDLKKFSKYKEYAEILREEVMRRCE